MQRMLGWMMLAVLCCAADPAAGEEPKDPRLQEAQAAFDQAMELNSAGKYADAIPKAEHALALRKAVLGETDLQVAASLNLLGTLYLLQGDFGRAESPIQRGLGIRETILGKSHPDVAASLHALASLYQEQGLYEQAEPLFLRALAIRETSLGKDHLDVAKTLGKLANIYRDQHLYSRAEPLFLRALAILELNLGKDHPDVEPPLHNLAMLYSSQGLDGQAEPLLNRAIAIDEARLSKNHPYLASDLNSLANLYSRQGLYSRAASLQKRAIAIFELTLGKNHYWVANSLSNLASEYAKQGLYTEAEPLLKRAIAIFELTFGKEHPMVSIPLGNLANLYQDQGFYSRAQPLQERALAIQERSLEPNHPNTALSLTNLAAIYMEQGAYSRAKPLFERSLAIFELAHGKNYFSIAPLLNALAQLHLAQGHHALALPLLTRAFQISETRLRRDALDLSESRLTSFLQLLRTDEERLYALLRAYPEDLRVQRLALTAMLLRKGRSADELADTSRTIYRSLGAQDRETFARLRDLRTQLAKLSLDGPGKLALADHQQRLKELADQGDALEADLAKRSAPLRALTALPSPDDIVDRVAAALPKDGALVELVAYQDRPLVPKPGTPPSRIPSQLRYLALVLFPDARIRALDLGPAAPIDSAASRLRNAFARRDADYLAPSQALYKVAFQPLLPLLGDVHRIFLAPDGQLGLVPFAALHDGRQFLVDTYDFTYLTSGKDLLPRPDGLPQPRSVVVLADPDFGTPPAVPSSRSADDTSTLAQRSYDVERFFSSLRADLAEHPWPPLPGTRQEAEAIQHLIPQAQLLLGADATKDRLLHLATPGVLHIATHGFFLEDAASSTGSRSVGNFGALGQGSPQRPPDPLLRSGLVLAGARAPATQPSGDAKSSRDDSLVTALELAGLDLWGTELVVLSACDTGRGDVKLGQGVYGLRRALVVAGAETVVMSLWKVNDQTTRALMEGYYRNLLAGQGRAQALREAMRALRESQPHPHAWAPFIALGKDAPLRALAPVAPSTTAP